MPFNREPVNSSPSVWHRFQRKNDEGQVRNFKVQDVSEKDKTQVLELALTVFLMDEPITKFKDIIHDLQSLEEIKRFWVEALKENTSLICFEELSDGTSRLAGFNFLTVSCKDSEKDEEESIEKAQGDNFKQVIKLLIYASKSVDPFERYDIDKYLSGCGLFVHRGYRGLKIGGEILKAREPMCKALGIKATLTVFTSIPSQKLAANCGYELLKEIPYNSQELLLQGIDFSGMTEVLSCKLLGIKF